MCRNFSAMVFLLVNYFTSAYSEESVTQCCRQSRVPEVCVRTLCDPSKPPNDFDIYDVFERRTNCSKHLKEIAQCLAGGRDHSKCCTNEAKDREENACFGLCRGHVEHQSPWTNYQTCLAINLSAMFACFRKGYETAPTPPRDILVGEVGTREAEISWTAPSVNPEAAERYQIVYVDSDGENYDEEYEEELDEKMREESVSTEERKITLRNLQPGTKYALYIIAIRKDESQRSLASDTVHFSTTGIAPEVTPYKKVVTAAKEAESAVMACRFRVSGASPHIRVEWRQKGTQVTKDARHNITFYLAATKPREYVTTLEILNVDQLDFGAYHCHIFDDYGDGSAPVELQMAELRTASPYPPETPIGCCRTRGVQNRCLSMCGAMEPEIKKPIPRPFMPSNCSVEIGKVLSCGMPGVDDSGCCLKEQMPIVCMYLCDSSRTPNNNMAPICIRHMASAEQCRARSITKRPSAVVGLKAHSSAGTEAVVLRWDPSNGAEIYHVYWRRQNDVQWEQKSLVGTTKKVMGAEEVVVIAANANGISQAARLTFVDSQWIR